MNRYAFSVAGCYTLWGVLPIFWHLLVGVDSIYTLSNRIVWSCAASAVAVLLTKRGGELRAALGDKKTMLAMLGSAVAITVNWGAYIWCMMNDMVLDASLAYYINPIISILAGFVIYKERLSRLQWLSVGLALVGVVYPMLAGGSVPWLALLIAVAFALYGVIKKNVSLPGSVSTLLETMIVSPIFLTLIIVMEARGTGGLSSGALTGWSVLLLPAAGLVTFLPLALFSRGVQHTSLSLTGILMYINPTLQMLVGVLLYGEELSGAKLVTFIFVWAAVIIFVLAGRAAHTAKDEKKETVKV